MGTTSARSALIFGSALVAFGAITACASSRGEEALGTSESALKRQDQVPDEPKAPQRDAGGPRDASVADGSRPPFLVLDQLPVLVVQQPTYCGSVTYMLRRGMAGGTCASIPNVVTEASGARYVYDTHGRYRIDSVTAPESAPVEFRDRTCKITFEKSCDAPQNAARDPRAKLGLDAHDALVSTSDLVFFGGTGHCDVCGFASGTHMWAVLPWDYFSYEIDSTWYTHQLTTDDVSVFEFDLPTSVPPQDVRIRRGGPL